MDLSGASGKTASVSPGAGNPLRVLILTAGFGEGHNAAARNIQAALQQRAGENADVQMVDLFHEAHPRLNRLGRKLYAFAISRLPGVWNLCFRIFDRTTLADEIVNRTGGVSSVFFRVLNDFAPDVVLSVYPGYGPLVAPAARARRFRFITMVTDSLTVNAIWHRAGGDVFVVANDPTAGALREAGIAPGRIRVLGFPVPLDFAELNVQRGIPPEGPWKVLYMVNSHAHKAAKLVRRILKLPKVELSVAVGHNAALGRKLRAVAEAEGRAIQVYGWSAEMPRLIAEHHVLIGKAGGATTQEALAAGTPMIVNQVVPGQEEGNARLITEGGAGVCASEPDAIADALAGAFDNHGALWLSWEKAAKTLGRPGAALEIADMILAKRIH